MKRKCRRIEFSNQPLVLVMCQVRISSIKTISEYIPAIQEEFRRKGYPIEKSGKIQRINIGPTGVQATEQDRWEFRTKEENWSIIILEDSFILQTTAYSTFECFAEKLNMAASIILSITDHDKLGVIHRIGLRYVNLIQPNKDETFHHYLKKELHGLPDHIFQNNTGRMRLECAGHVDVDDIPGALIVRVSQDATGVDLPRDLLINAPERNNNIKSNELVTFIDLDHFIEGKFDPDLELIQKNIFLLHDNIVETLHDHIITKEAVATWK